MSNYIFTVTDVGIAAANAANLGGPKINISTFKVGSAVNFVPVTTDTELHGSVLHTGAIFDYRVDSNNQVTYLMRLDASVGSFLFGEVGLYLSTGELFAIASLTQVQEKIAAAAGTPGNIITFEARCILSNLAPAIVFPMDSIVYSKLPEVGAPDNLPNASDSNQSNAFSIQTADENGNSCVALRNSSSQTWAFSTHNGLVVTSTVATASTTQILDVAIGTLVSSNFSTRRFIIEFISGALKSVSRYVTASTAGVINFAALPSTPLAGSQYVIYRSNVSLSLSPSLPQAETIGVTGSAGLAIDVSRSDHRHAMPGIATPTVPGFLSAADKAKLDTIAASGAALTSETPLNLATATVGTSNVAARGDHVHNNVAATQAPGDNSTKIATTAFVAASFGTLTGIIMMWPMPIAPSGFLMCNGQAVSRTTYSALFSIVGSTFGAGDGGSTFNLPDYRDRLPVGAGSTYAANDKGGSKDAVLVNHTHAATSTSSFAGNGLGSHSHTVYDPGHSHGIYDPGHNHTNGIYTNLLRPPYWNSLTGNDRNGSGSEQAVGPDDSQPMQARATGIGVYSSASSVTVQPASIGTPSGSVTTGTTITAVGVSATNANMPPYLGTYYIIKT